MRERLSATLPVLAVLCACSAAHGPGPGRSGGDLAERGLARLLHSRDLEGNPVGPPAPATAATVVVVFATWCEPCRHELATLGDLAGTEPRLRIVGVNAYEEWGARSDDLRMRRFLAEHAPWLQVVVRADQRLLDAFGGIPRVPTLFVYDAAGALVREFRRSDRDPPTRQELEEALAAALR